MKRNGLIFALILALLLSLLPMTAMAAVGESTNPESGDINVPVTPGGGSVTPGTYTVTFKDRNGTTLSSDVYVYGADLVFPQVEDPIVDVYGVHTFVGWLDSKGKEAPNSCLEAATYTATYETAWKEYTVTFKNDDGSMISTETYHYGDAVVTPADPTKAADANYTYTFAGWDETVTAVSGDATYTATYTKTPKAPAKNGWVQENGKWCYYENGVKVANCWKMDSAGWCYLGADGYFVTNSWVKDSVGWCYLNSNGRMVYNQWVKDSVGWCYVGSSGYMIYNQWVLSGGKWYFLDSNGYMVTNAWRKDSKGWCWLTASGAMATNQWVKDSKGWCYIGADGYCWTNCWAKDSVGWVWLDKEGSMVYNQWILDGGKWYYVGANGYMLYSTSLRYNGKTYNFNASGVCTNP